MKNISLLFFVLIALASTACKKDYDCKAVDETGAEVVLKCENCSKKNVEDYEKSILDKGFVTADCAKK